MIELAHIQNKYLTQENILLKEHIVALKGIIHKLDVKDIGEAIFKLHETIVHLQAQIYDLHNQNCEYEYRFKRMSLAADLRFQETRSSFYDGEPMPWKKDDKPTPSTKPPSSSTKET
mgnify:CR=1 FL=1